MLTKTEGSSLFVAHGNVQPLWKTSLMVSQKTNGGSEGKPFAYNVGDLGSIPGMGRSPGERNGNPLQYSSLENPMDRGAWRVTIHGVIKQPSAT